jgi:hypothetical protein
MSAFANVLFYTLRHFLDTAFDFIKSLRLGTAAKG